MQRWVALLALVGLLYLVRSILPPFVLAAVMAYGLSPVVSALAERTGWRQGVAAGVLYAGLLSVIGGVLWAIEPRLVGETKGLAAHAPEIMRGLFTQVFGSDRVELLGVELAADELWARTQGSIAEYLGQPRDALHLLAGLIEGVGHLFLFLIVSFYFVVDGERIGSFLLRLVPPEGRERIASIAERVHAQLGRYLRGQLYLVVLMSAVTWVVLHFVFNLRYALPVAILTGVLEIIPIIGPITATAIAATIGLTTIGVGHAAWIVVAYTVLRQVEDQVVMPIVVGRAVHLHPVVTIFAVLAGGAIAGLLGLLLAIPAAAALKVVLDEYLHEVETTPAPEDAPLAPGKEEHEVARQVVQGMAGERTPSSTGAHGGNADAGR